MLLAPVLILAAILDPGGWSKAKWGMTEQQLVASFGREIVRLNPPVPMGLSQADIDASAEFLQALENVRAQIAGTTPRTLPPPSDKPHVVLARLAIRPVELSNTQFQALLIPDSAGRLDSVLLTPLNDDDATDALFDSLEQLLVQKYGRPWVTTDSGDKEIQWTLPTTVVTLSLTHFFLTHHTSVSLQYKRKPASKLL